MKMLIQNLDMCKNIFSVLKKKKVEYLLYVSSDAVYSDSKKPISEKSETEPNNLHGFMHLMRENILKLLDIKLCIVRPTLVYGCNDTHNGYGPNQFIRLAQSKKNISLFGKGEERRDHIHVNDVGNAIYFLVNKKYVRIEKFVLVSELIHFLRLIHNNQSIYKVKIQSLRDKISLVSQDTTFNNNLLKKILPKENNFIKISDSINKKEKYKIK